MGHPFGAQILFAFTILKALRDTLNPWIWKAPDFLEAPHRGGVSEGPELSFKVKYASAIAHATLTTLIAR